MSEHTTMFLHFSPEEDMPRIGDTIQATSEMTRTTYRITILAIRSREVLSNGTIKLEAFVEREAQA